MNKGVPKKSRGSWMATGILPVKVEPKPEEVKSG